MPKKRLTEIAEEYGIPFEEALDLVFKELEEEMVTGRGKNTWINDDGQRVLEEVIPMPVVYRGPVLSLAPNPNYVMAYIKDIVKKVPVKIPSRYRKNIVGKTIYIEADNSGRETKYFYVKPKFRS